VRNSRKFKKVIHLENITHDVFRESLASDTCSLIIKFLKNKRSIYKMPEIIDNDLQFEEKDSEIE